VTYHTRICDVVAPAPQLFSPVRSDNTFQVSLATICGHTYVLEFKDALTDSTWTAILPGTAGDDTVKTLVDTSATGSQRFYRVRVE
jgi:hypothetical protein